MNARINYLAIIVSIVVLFSSCTKTIVSDGSTEIVSEQRDLENYENVTLNGIFETKITQGEAYKFEIIGTEHVLDNIHSRVNNNTLTITMDEIEYGDIKVDILITIPTLAEVTKLGVGNTRVEGFQNLTSLEIHHNGVAAFSMEGSVDHLHLENSGIGSFEGFDLEVNKCNIDQNGIGNVKLKCAESLIGELNGIGNIYYMGDPVVNVEINGIGTVKSVN